MGSKPRPKLIKRYETCLCCGAPIGCRVHDHCQQLCLVGLCLGCAAGNCIDEALADLRGQIAYEADEYRTKRAALQGSYAALAAAKQRAKSLLTSQAK